MLTFLGISEFGRLGNQLFRYAAVKCLSLHTSRPVVLPHPNLKSFLKILIMLFAASLRFEMQNLKRMQIIIFQK